MQFQYLEVRACIKSGGVTNSYIKHKQEADEPLPTTFVEAMLQHMESGKAFEVFWSMYGILENNRAIPIGRFDSEDQALGILRDLVEPISLARDIIKDGNPILFREWDDAIQFQAPHLEKLEFFINQCSNEDRT